MELKKESSCEKLRVADRTQYINFKICIDDMRKVEFFLSELYSIVAQSVYRLS